MTDEEKKILYDMDAKINELEGHINELTKSQSYEIKELYHHGVGPEYDGDFAKKLGTDPEIWSKEE